MSKSFSILALAMIAGAGWALLAPKPATSQDKPKKEVPDAKLDLETSKFMRRKLEASGQILEGLTIEDADLIIKGAKILVELSAAEKFQVQHDVVYRQFSGEFQRTAKGLLAAAEKKNYDAVALKWVDTTMKCLEFHKVVRGMHIADAH